MLMKNLILLAQFTACTAGFTLYAQEPESHEFDCGFDVLRELQMQQDPELYFKLERMEKRLWRHIEQGREAGGMEGEFMGSPPPAGFDSGNCPGCFPARYLLPVVFHVFHLPDDSMPGMGSNISEYQAQQAIAAANRIFAAYGHTDSNAVNTGIQFYLAPVGPDSNGILRYSDTLSDNYLYQGGVEMFNKTDPYYNHRRFINVYIVNRLLEPNGTVSGIAGYSYMPGSVYQFMVVRHEFMADYTCCDSCNLYWESRGKTFAHELGHYLSLLHPFEGGCAGVSTLPCHRQGDKCCDTPPANNFTTNCSNPFSNACAPDYTPILTGNCMEYTREYCGSWLTRNQTERMLNTVELYRASLLNPDSLNRWRVPGCGLTAHFTGRQTILCDPDSAYLSALDFADGTVKYR
jgi:hypothetical protein